MDEGDKLKFVRKGDILHPFGVLQAIHLYDNELTKEQFGELVKLNYDIDELTDTKIKDIDYSWEEAISRLERCNALYFADDNIIKANLLDYIPNPYIRPKSRPIYKYLIKQYEDIMKLWI